MAGSKNDSSTRMLVLCPLLLLTACAARPSIRVPAELFADHLFAPHSTPVQTTNLFAPSEAMQAYLAGPFAKHAREHGPMLGLIEALRKEVRLEYDAKKTRTAAEAFDARAGNCLSLVIMASVLARELGIPTQIQSVRGADTWMRASGIAFRSGHVNLVLGVRSFDTIQGWNPASSLIVDFLPPPEAMQWAGRVISEEAVVAMFGNNRAAETLAEGDANTAYWWVRAAIFSSPTFLPAFNTLAVVYMRHGNLPEAERALRHGLDRAPENIEILTNLTLVLSRQGRGAEAAVFRRQLAEIAPDPPYQFLDLGLAALARGETEEAARLIRKEARRMPYDDEVNLALAVVTLRLGDVGKAHEYIRRALDNSPTHERRDIYSSKLKHLESLQPRD